MSPPDRLPDKLVRGIWLKALAGDRTPALDAELEALGLNLSQPLLPSYPRSVWFPALQCTSRALFPDAGEAGGMFKLGQKLIDGLEARGVFASTGFAVIRLLGPRRLLRDVGPRLAGLGLGVELAVREHGRNDIELMINEGEGACFLAGALEKLLAVLGGRAPKVDVGPSPLGSALRARWS